MLGTAVSGLRVDWHIAGGLALCLASSAWTVSIFAGLFLR